MLALLVGCGGGSAPNHGRTTFLLIAHQPLAGELAASSDRDLLDLGSRACAEMDRKTPSDQIVADLGDSPEPGSARFNSYSFLVVAAASQLCPAHKAQFDAGSPLSASRG